MALICGQFVVSVSATSTPRTPPLTNSSQSPESIGPDLTISAFDSTAAVPNSTICVPDSQSGDNAGLDVVRTVRPSSVEPAAQPSNSIPTRSSSVRSTGGK